MLEKGQEVVVSGHEWCAYSHEGPLVCTVEESDRERGILLRVPSRATYESPTRVSATRESFAFCGACGRAFIGDEVDYLCALCRC